MGVPPGQRGGQRRTRADREHRDGPRRQAGARPSPAGGSRRAAALAAAASATGSASGRRKRGRRAEAHRHGRVGAWAAVRATEVR